MTYHFTKYVWCYKQILYVFIAILEDIEKAFLQIGVQENECDVTKFLWFTDPTKPERVEGNYLFTDFVVYPLALFVVLSVGGNIEISS